MESKNNKFVNKEWKGVISEKIQTWFSSKDLSSVDVNKKDTRENIWNISRKYIRNI